MKRYWSLLLCITVFAVSCKDVPEEQPLKEGLMSTDIVNNPYSAEGIDSATYNDLPTMDFEDTLYNFGSITEGDKVTHHFTFRNNGKTPLIISSAKGSCGCAAADYPRDPVKPGDSGIVKVVFNSVDKKGHVEKSIAITTNTAKSIHMLNIKADVQEK